jgi:hypothetical protein
MTRKRFRRALHIAPLVLPPIISTIAIDPTRMDSGFVHLGLSVLAALATGTVGALLLRCISDRRSDDPWQGLEVLTATGRSTMWASTAAIVLGSYVQWASLDVLGLLGMGIVYLTVGWMAYAGHGEGPWLGAEVKREIVPASSVEGDELRDEIRIRGVAIAPGLRLFVSAPTCDHGAVSRHAVGSEASRAAIRFDSEIGEGRRGDHVAAPFPLWFSDVLGLTRSPAVYGRPTPWTVMPRPAKVDGARALLGDGGDDTRSRATERFPTEGSFRIREYAAGDDARRIHWVRSLQANRLVVRLPDEVPIGEPTVRLLLDTHLATEPLTCRGHHELLDALVRTWLGIGTALADAGARVTVVAAMPAGDGPVVAARPLYVRAPREALQLGARACWQPTVPLEALASTDGARQIVVSSRPRMIDGMPDVTWIIVPEMIWTTPEELPRAPELLTHAFPFGAPENRRGHRRRTRAQLETKWRDRMMFGQLVSWPEWSQWSGAYVARPDGDRGSAVLQEVP